MKEYRIYPLQDQSRLPEICTLFAKGLADTKPEYWKWKHYSENGLPEGMILVAESENGAIAGMFALQPARYICGDKEMVIVQGEDLVIDPDHRGSGLMKKLYAYAFQHYKNLGAVGFIDFCNPVSYPIFMKYGGVDMGDIYAHSTAKSLLPVYIGKKRCSMNNWQLELVDEMPGDLFYSRSSEVYRMKKSDIFMKWKFAENPDGPFRWLTIRKNGQLEGYLVVHVTQGRLRRAVNIYDWELKDEVDGAVLRRAVNLLRTHGNWVSLWGLYSDDILARWAQAGVANKNERGTHFVLNSFTEDALPGNWQLTRADLDY